MGSTGALAAVARRERTTPRIVFDCPKTGRPSTNTTPRLAELRIEKLAPNYREAVRDRKQDHDLEPASGHCKAPRKL
jgi:hypothetical protein